jgi:hypothetical protein
LQLDWTNYSRCFGGRLTKRSGVFVNVQVELVEIANHETRVGELVRQRCGQVGRLVDDDGAQRVCDSPRYEGKGNRDQMHRLGCEVHCLVNDHGAH